MSLQKLAAPKRTMKMLAEELMQVFENHIGHANGITKKKLFQKLFGHAYRNNNYEDFYKADLMRRALHHLRVYSTCFVAAYYDGDSVQKYCVISTKNEAQHYVDVLHSNIKRMKLMQKRAMKSIDERWYAKKFEMRRL